MEPGWIALIVLVGVCVLSWLWSLLTAPGFNVRDKHVLLTGTENPLGLAIAKKYLNKGAKVSLIGPSTESLKAAQSELEKVAKGDSPIFTFEYELTDFKQVEQAVQEANAFHGRPTDHVVYGASRRIKPGYFWEQDVALMKEAMDVNYTGAVVVVKAALPAMIEAKNHGRIVFVSSADSLEFPVGCGACSGSKSAIRGLADSLRNELLLYNISVAVFYPGTSSFNLLDTSAARRESASSSHQAEEASTPGVNEGHITTGYSTGDRHGAGGAGGDRRVRIGRRVHRAVHADHQLAGGVEVRAGQDALRPGAVRPQAQEAVGGARRKVHFLPGPVPGLQAEAARIKDFLEKRKREKKL